MKHAVVESYQSPLRLVLLHGEVRRLSEPWSAIRIRTGRAWLTIDGRDVLLQRGQKFVFVSTKDFGLISAVGHIPLVVEISRVGIQHAAGPLGMFIPRFLARKPAIKIEDMHGNQPR